MRIDLIPDIPPEPVAPGTRRVVLAPRKQRTLQIRPPRFGVLSRYQELLQGLYDAALITDLSGSIIDVNVRATEFFLYPREDLCRLNILDVISGADRSLLQTIKEHLESERHALIQAYCVRRDGTSFPAEIAVSRLAIGEPHLGFFVRDITIRRQAEEMLRTEHNAIQNAANGIAVADLENRLEYVNPALARMWGYDSTNEILGLALTELFQDRSAVDKIVAEVAGTDQPWTGELKAKRRDGSLFDVEMTVARNRNSDGEVVGFVYSFMDIGDRKRAEEALKEAERHRVMLESLGAACHHLGQPATMLMGNLELMRAKLAEADPSVRELLETSIENIRRLGEVLKKLQTVDKYRTTPYAGTQGTSESSSILKI